MKNFLIALGVLVGAVILYDIYVPEPEPALPVPVVKSAVKEDVIREGYMEGCTEENASLYDYCECTYNYLELTIGKNEIAQFGLDVLDDPNFDVLDIPEVMDAVEFCLDEI